MSRPSLVIEKADGSRAEVVLGEETYLGRAPSNDVVLDDPSVSRRHALIRAEPTGEFLLIDLGSANGTVLNGEHLVAPRILKDRDRVKIGSASLVFLQPETETRAASSILDEGGTEFERGARDVPLLGTGPAMAEVFRLLERAATSSIPVLIEGETGTGKELVARTIHRASSRANGAFVAINCAALSDVLLEQGLFGRPGLFEAAAGGSVLLDEIHELPLEIQPKLLRVIEAESSGGSSGSTAGGGDFRLISASSLDLGEQVARGRFRSDLYYRVAAFVIRLPSLRERREDIPLLAERFLVASASRHGKQLRGIEHSAVDALTRFGWPGNVRELRNEIDRAVTLARDGDTIGMQHLSPRVGGARVERTMSDGSIPAESLLDPASSAGLGNAENTLRRQGDYWTIVFRGVEVRLKDTKGLHYLAHLLRNPGWEFPASELVSVVAGAVGSNPAADTLARMTDEQLDELGLRAGGLGDVGEVLDRQARASYRRRLTDLRDQLGEAESFNDPERATRIRAEIEVLGEELTRGMGFGGRDQKAGSSAERARVSVTKAIGVAVQKISRSSAALGQYLARNIKTGTFCSYAPEPDDRVTWKI